MSISEKKVKESPLLIPSQAGSLGGMSNFASRKGDHYRKRYSDFEFAYRFNQRNP